MDFVALQQTKILKAVNRVGDRRKAASFVGFA
jgi:hypothetical protein